MKKPKSEYVRSKIRRKRFGNSNYVYYVENLLRLEGIALHGTWGLGSPMAYGMRNVYKREYMAILKDLNPKKYEKYVQELKDEKRKNHEDKIRQMKEEKARIARDKKVWLSLGGKP